MSDNENRLQKGISRGRFVKSAGAGIGIAAGALMFGTGIAGAQTAPQAGEIAETPFPYADLDRDDVLLRGHAGYYKGGCAYGAFWAIVSSMRAKVGGPWNQMPYRTLRFGGAGIAGWGTICGALNGACAAIALMVADADISKVCNELLGWYSRFPFPSKESNDLAKAGAYKYTDKPYLKVDLVTSVSDSPLCHVSNAKWIAASGKGLSTPERKERCARVTADVVAKTVELVTAYKAGTLVPAFKLDPETANCLSCHAESQEGKMVCTTCHEPH